MFCIELAGSRIRINNRYTYIKAFCRDYLSPLRAGEQPAFTVTVSTSQIDAQRELARRQGRPLFPDWYYEGVCVYQEIFPRLLLLDTLFLHASVLVVDDKAYAFLAPSGGGKTTQMRLWLRLFKDRARILNGDKPLFHLTEDAVIACPTPWKGKEGAGEKISAPLSALLFITKDSRIGVQRMTKEKLIPRLLSQTLPPRDEAGQQALISLCLRLLDQVSAYDLHCDKTMDSALYAARALSLEIGNPSAP